MSSSKRHVVASIDLDRSRDTRLEQAIDRLRGERVRIESCRWNDPPPYWKIDLLVVGTETNASRGAVDSALLQGIAVIRIGSLPWDPAALRSLDIGVGVDELAACMRERLETGDSEPAADTLARPAILEHLLSTSDGHSLLESGLFRVVADHSARRLHLLRRMPYPELVAEVTRSHWFVTPLTAKRFVEAYAADVVESYSLESVVWDVAVACAAPIAEVPADRPIRLRAWPLSARSALPAQWMLPLSCLLDRAWMLPKLAHAITASDQELQRVYAAVLASGLAETDGADSAFKRTPANEQPGLLHRLARRFGLSLSRVWQ
ncbi:hypothetical protein [Pseudomonas sp. CGJS7]|uniref:hypothetical protein n=1 Tax=Pseudomonas sp. CGJS7 TaxID=3109348 RepID=UPI00300B9D7D